MSLESLENLTLSLIKIKSPSGEEDGVRKFLLDYISKQKFSQNFDLIQDGNALIYTDKRRHSKRIMLCAHIDTVPGVLPVKMRDGVIFGRGAVDIKSGVAILLKLMENLHSTVADFVFYDNEEALYSANGLGRCVDRGILPEAYAAIVLEPTELVMELGCHSSLNLALKFAGKGGHSAALNRGENPIFKSMLSIEHVQRLFSYRKQTVNSFDYFYSLEPVKINAGVANNVVPQTCDVTVNLRFPPSIDMPAMLDELKNHMLFQPDVEVLDYSPGAPPQVENEWISNSIKTFPYPLRSKREWCDVARLYSLGIPAFTFGPGDISLAHSNEEKVSVEDIVKAYNVINKILD